MKLGEKYTDAVLLEAASDVGRLRDALEQLLDAMVADNPGAPSNGCDCYSCTAVVGARAALSATKGRRYP